MANYLICVKYVLVFSLVFLEFGANGHPQCLDSAPPFQSTTSLTFCRNYQEFGCCTQNVDVQLRQRFDAIRRAVTLSYQDIHMWSNCSDYVQTFLCQTCSPYAAHIFDSEQNQYNEAVVQRVFPGLCGAECSTFYQTCRHIVHFYLEEARAYPYPEKTRLLDAINLGEAQFCSAISLSDKDYCFPDLLTNPILNGNISIDKITQDGCICMEPFDKVQFRNPIFLKHANDGSGRMFIGEQIGSVHIMYPNGTLLPRPFLDIEQYVKTTASKGDERGMLGMEFHPNFTTNGLLYLYYSTPLDRYERSQMLGDHKTRIEELRVHPNNPNEIDINYSRIIMEVYEPWWNHNGGEILFGDDGYLYLFVGDGGKAGDPLNSGQNLSSMLGKVHRIDVDKPDLVRGKQYSIPPDNPFADGFLGLPEIYAYGVRNIWRCGKDRGDPKTKKGKGRILCGDVGQGAVEEINLIQKGANYGWKLKEGTADYCYTCPIANVPNVTLTDPVFDYPHSVGKSVTGGHFYRGCQSPNFNGFYFYGDFMSGRLFRLTEPKDPNQYYWDNKELKMCGSDWCKPPLTNDYSTSIISFGEDEDGEVYMLSTSYASTASSSGTVYKLVDPIRRGNPEECKSAIPQTTPVYSPTVTTPTTTQETTTKKTVVSAGNTVSPGAGTSFTTTTTKATTVSTQPPVSWSSIMALIQHWLKERNLQTHLFAP